MKIQGKVYLVGGAVRDYIMAIPPKDRDYVIVGGSEDNLLSLGFKKVGADFPVFLHPETGEEYALARTEKKAGVGYHGFTVETEGVSLRDDLMRRDFTMNAMAMDTNTGEIIDPFGGQNDINSKLLRHFSSSFVDDPLRVLRACRFAARYGYVVSEETCQAIKKVSFEELSTIPKERILLEIEKSIKDGTFDQFFELLYNFDITWVVTRVLGSGVYAKYTSRGQFIEKSIGCPVDGYLTYLISLNGDFGFDYPDFTGVAKYVKVAKCWEQYKPGENSLRFISAIGDSKSESFKILKEFIRSSWPDWEYLTLVFNVTQYVIKTVNASSVDSSLTGKELGAAIYLKRKQILNELIV